MAETDLAELIDDLVEDEWRMTHPFSPEMQQANVRLLGAASDDERAAIMGEWIERHQPCTFGRLAAKRDKVSYCFLTEAEILSNNDRYVRAKIAQARLQWRGLALTGDRHAFIIAIVSERVMNAEPNAALLAVALRVASLYLNRSVLPDSIEQDELFLDIEGIRRQWRVGVDHFASQGDGRWWKDHRFPGGMGFSMNSVGHMGLCVRMGRTQLEAGDDPLGLLWALGMSMRLLDNTTAGVSGRNTWLLDLAETPATTGCPFPDGETPEVLKGKNYCQYGGLYHTDHTIRSSHFDPSELRGGAPLFSDLDLTYLHHDSPDSDYRTMARGRDF